MCVFLSILVTFSSEMNRINLQLNNSKINALHLNNEKIYYHTFCHKIQCRSTLNNILG